MDTEGRREKNPQREQKTLRGDDRSFYGRLCWDFQRPVLRVKDDDGDGAGGYDLCLVVRR